MIAVLLKVGGGASVICICTYKTEHTLQHVIVSYPRTVAPLNRTWSDKARVLRRVCKQLVKHVYAKEKTTYLFLR